MREYAKAEPKMWHGSTMKALRKRGSEGVIVALYLMTSPNSNMLGLFSQPILYMAHETGLGVEGASKGLKDCIEVGFCSFDEDSEMVWVHEMARYQVAPVLKASDLRCKGIQRDYLGLPDNPFLGPFFDRYAEAFNLTKRRGVVTESDGNVKGLTKPLTKPLRSQEQEQEQEQEQDPPSVEAQQAPSKPASPAAAAAAPTGAAVAGAGARGSRLPIDWVLPKAWGEWALAEFKTWTPEKVRTEAARFKDHWTAKTGKDATKADWLATWRNWCRSDIAQRSTSASKHTGANGFDRETRDAQARALLGFTALPFAASTETDAIDG